MTIKPSPETLARLAAVVGDKYAITDPAAMTAYMTEWREIWTGKSPLVGLDRGGLENPDDRR